MAEPASEYDEFKLRLETDGSGDYRVLAVGPDERTARGTFTPPCTDDELDDFVRSVGLARRTRRSRSERMEKAKAFGSELFTSLIKDSVAEVYLASLSTARANGRGLRITLQLSGAPELMRLPWEFLYRRPRFLSQSATTPIVRSLDLDTARPPREIQLPLRILGVVSSPTGYEELDADEERHKLEAALGGLLSSGRVELDWLERATLNELERRIAQPDDIHVLHYIGHGAYDEATEAGIVVLETARGRPLEVLGEDLGAMLQDEESLRLVVLNSCEGARTSLVDPFSGVAASLIEFDIPAVIGMQFEITDEAAIAFSDRLYTALSHGSPIDGALAQARRGIVAAEKETEFATPVLFLRQANAQLFDVASPAAVRKQLTECTVARDGSGDFETIASGLDALAPGGKLFLGPGTYRETLNITTADITISGTTDRSEAVVSPQNLTPITVSARNLRLMNLTLHDVSSKDDVPEDDPETARPCIDVVDGNVEIDNCEITSDNNNGLRVSGHASVSVRGSTLHNGLLAVILVDSASGDFEATTLTGARIGMGAGDEATVVLRRCEIHNNVAAGVAVGDNGRGTIEDNEVFGNGLKASEGAEAGVAIGVAGRATPVVRRNKIHDNEMGVAVGEDARGTIEDNDIFGHKQLAVVVVGGADPVFRRNKIHDNEMGVAVSDDARGMIEDNDIFGHQRVAVLVSDGAAPIVRRNKIHDNTATAMWFADNGRGTIQDNDIFGHTRTAVVITDGADPVVRRNKVHDNTGNAVFVDENARGTIEDNDISGHQKPAVAITTGADPFVRRNKIHDNESHGVIVRDDGRGTIEDNDISGSQAQAVAVTSGADPVVRRNKIHDNSSNGIHIFEDGRGTIEDNDVYAHQKPAVAITTRADPIVRRNKIHDNESHGVIVRDDGRGTIEANHVVRNKAKAIWIESGSSAVCRDNYIEEGAP